MNIRMVLNLLVCLKLFIHSKLSDKDYHFLMEIEVYLKSCFLIIMSLKNTY